MMKHSSYFPCLLLLVVCAIGNKSPTSAFVPLLASPRHQLMLKTRPLASTVVAKEPSTSEERTHPHNADDDEPLLDMHMGRLKLPRMAVGKDCVAIPVKIHEQGPFEFMLDTGLTAQMISPRLKQALHNIGDDDPTTVEGLAAGGSTGRVKMVDLSDVSLCSEEKELDLPTLHALVTNFAQENMDRKHPVTGMLGMEMLESFDVDLDFPSGRVRLWKPGTAVEEAKRQGMVEIPIVVINESLLLGTRITGKLANKKESNDDKSKQPFIGIIDSGSTFSAINWKAAQLMGLPPQKSLTYLKPPGIMAVGIDNKPLYVPTKKVEFTFCGDVIENKDGVIVGFTPPPPEWKPWKPVLTGIGDLPVFELVLGAEKTPFQGPAAIIGMDILSQRRVILESCTKDDSGRRSGRMFVSPV